MRGLMSCQGFFLQSVYFLGINGGIMTGTVDFTIYSNSVSDWQRQPANQVSMNPWDISDLVL